MTDSPEPDLDAPENSWLMLRTAVNAVMLDTLSRVAEADRPAVAGLRDSVGQKLTAEFLRVHPQPIELLAQMLEAGVIKIDFDHA